MSALRFCCFAADPVRILSVQAVPDSFCLRQAGRRGKKKEKRSKNEGGMLGENLGCQETGRIERVFVFKEPEVVW